MTNVLLISVGGLKSAKFGPNLASEALLFQNEAT